MKTDSSVQELKKILLDRTAELYAAAGGGAIPSRQIGCLAQAVAELAIEMGYRPKDQKTDGGQP